MTEIRGYQAQWRPYGGGVWYVIEQTNNPCFDNMFAAMEGCVLTHGDGFFRIVKLFTDGSTAVRFFAAFGDSAESDYRDK